MKVKSRRMHNSSLSILDLNDANPKGILILDKPTGITSFGVVAWARRVTGVKKIGHTGTLDPSATGLLVLLVGKAFTKLQQEFQGHDKTYQVSFLLGAHSETLDCDSTLVFDENPEVLSLISLEKVKEAAAKLVGERLQQVPIFSAVHVGGERLHRIARHDAEKARTLAPSRQVVIHSITKIKKNQKAHGLPCFSFEVSCSSGTYIRSLVVELAELLGCSGVVFSLRRTQSGPFFLDSASVCPVLTRRTKIIEL